MPAAASLRPRTSRAFRQLPLQPWPEGLCRAAALLRLEPWDLGKRCGLSFARSHDDLDFIDVAIAQPTRSRTAFALVRHLGSPAPGTELWIREDARNLAASIATALKTLGLSPRHLAWVREGGDHLPNSRQSGTVT